MPAARLSSFQSTPMTQRPRVTHCEYHDGGKSAARRALRDARVSRIVSLDFRAGDFLRVTDRKLLLKLLGRGGGAYLCETDSNLTCVSDDPCITVHWEGKFRSRCE